MHACGKLPGLCAPPQAGGGARVHNAGRLRSSSELAEGCKHTPLLIPTRPELIPVDPCLISQMQGGAHKESMNAWPLQSTSSILEASSAAPSTSSSGGKSSSSPRPSSSSSMLRPSLIMRWMRPANCVGSSRLNPEVRSDVSKRSQIRSLTVLSDLSAAAFFFSPLMMECLGFTSIVFLETIYDVMELSRSACAFMMRSMFALQPYSEVVRTQGESAMREETMTFSTLSPSTSFMSFVSGSNSALSSSSFFFSSSSSRSKPSFVVLFSFLPSNSFSCCTQYSSMGSTMYRTSRPFLRRVSRKGDDDTAAMDSPVM